MPFKTWAVGEEVLAADFNAYMQTQVVPQFASVAQRDTQWAAPPRGAMCVTTDTNCRWLFDGTVWRALYGAKRAYRNAAQNIATGVWTVLNCDATRWANDPAGICNWETAGAGWRIARAGIYRVDFTIGNYGAAAGRRAVLFLLNGANYSYNGMTVGATIMIGLSHTDTFNCVANDLIQIQIYQDSGTTSSVVIGIMDTTLTLITPT